LACCAHRALSPPLAPPIRILSIHPTRILRGITTYQVRSLTCSPFSIAFSSLSSICTANPDFPLQWNPLRLEIGNVELFEYCKYNHVPLSPGFPSLTNTVQCTALQSLAIFPHDPRELSNALIQMTIRSQAKSATAALLSLLAFASIHRHNVHSQAVELKLAALKAMSAITGSHVGTEEATHHVIAGMLLLSFEVSRPMSKTLVRHC
jgi:hypothetical protein